MDIISELNKIPIIDLQISKIFEIIEIEYGKGKEFTKKELLYLLNEKNLLKNINVFYNIYNDIDDQIYYFDINRKKRGRPSKNNNTKIILSENINVDNIFWENIYIFKNKDIGKYWRYNIKNNNQKYTIIINQGLIINKKYDKGIVVDKTFVDKNLLDNFINKNISEKINYGYNKIQ